MIAKAEPEPLAITPPPALGPPIIGTDPGSIPGIPQPVFAGGSATVPATPIPITGSPLLPPPQVGFGGNVLVGPAVPAAPVPPSVAGYPQPQFASGSGTVPTAASLFPMFTAAGASPPIVLNATQAAGANSPNWIAPPSLPLPTTPGIAAVVISTAPNIPQLPWNPDPAGQPLNTTLPTITGTTTTGSTLTAHNGTWANSPTSYVYEWMNNGTPISGATAATYVLQSSDSGAMISVRVTAINAHGEGNADSAAVGPITGTTRAAPASTPPKQPPPRQPPPPPPRHTSRR